MSGWGYGKHFGSHHSPYRNHFRGGHPRFTFFPLIFIALFFFAFGGWRFLPWVALFFVLPMLFWVIPMVIRNLRSVVTDVERDVSDFDKRKRGSFDYAEEKRKRGFDDAVDAEYVDLSASSRSPRYGVGDDGELVDLDEKPKRRGDYDYV